MSDTKTQDEEVPAEVTPRVVEAVMTSANSSHLAQGGQKSPLAKMIELAMSEAVTACYAAGITDPDEMREKMLQARQEVKERYGRAVEEALKQRT